MDDFDKSRGGNRLKKEIESATKQQDAFFSRKPKIQLTTVVSNEKDDGDRKVRRSYIIKRKLQLNLDKNGVPAFSRAFIEP